MLSVLRELMEIEVAAKTGAAPGERTPERLCMRNGYRERRLDTRVGSLSLPIPKLREGSYFPSFLEPRRRSEEALLAVIAEAYVKGVSTRKVEDLVAALGLDGISKSEVSRICARLDEQVEAFRGRPLVGRYPYLFLDATYEKVRDDSGRVVSMALVVAYGVAETGEREVLGLEVCRSEDYPFWRGFLSGLVARGLSGVASSSPMPTRASSGPSRRRSWGRAGSAAGCTSFAISSRSCPKTGRAWCWPRCRLVFQQPDKARASEELRALADRLAERLPRVSAALLEAEEEILAHMEFPQRALEADLLHQPLGTLEQGDQPPHPRRRHLPRREEPHPPDRRRLGRAERRMGRLPQIHEPALPRPHLPVINPGDRRRGHPRRCHSRPLTTKL